MTTATKDQLPAAMDMAADTGAPVSSLHPVDMGLLDTLTSRMHCRTPMKRVDPDETPLYQPVLVDGATVVPVSNRLSSAAGPSASVDTFRCACGFTIDVPAAASHALAS